MIRRLTPIVGGCLALLSVAVLQLCVMSLSIEVYDEGLILYGAARVADGALPYRDFWSMYAPGSFYALGALDHLFGQTVFVERCFDAACRALIVVLAYAAVRRRAGRLTSLAASLAICALLLAGLALSSSTLPATACALLAMLALERALGADLDSLTRGTWAATGVAAGLTTLFRQDLGAYLTVVCLGAMHLRAKRVSAFGVFRRGAGGGPFLAGLAIVVAPVLIALLLAVPLHDLYDSLVRIPTQVYPAYRSLPFPTPAELIAKAHSMGNLRPLLNLGVYLPPLVAAFAIATLLHFRPVLGGAGHATVAVRPQLDIGWVAWIALTLLFCLKAAVRTEFVHILPAIVVSIVLAAVTVNRLPWAKFGSVIAVLVIAASAARIAVLRVRSETIDAAILPASPWERLGALASGCGNRHGAPLGCFHLEKDNTAVLDYLRRHATPGASIYVGAGRHDKLLINNVELYFLSGMPSVTKWHDLHPGVQTTAAIQNEIIQKMQADPPAFVVLNTQYDDADEPNRSRESSGVTRLDDYIRSTFKPVFTSSTFTVLVPERMSLEHPP